ncbi:MAG: DNA-3-methyladenine glycosylase 2 family protein [Defluviitaleaceae bacterium]|nr:DNA-3-methyladenine glycosylase 2 family protein [Defluviitaleaceae bacterium]MCL2264317.1 DNA-3-methyladenine glycosylase 2 family protein [Defluviitaleaceae bacterium]
MDYTYAEQKNCDVVVGGVRYFDLAQTLDCGQAFRWREVGANGFSGIAHGRRLDVELEGDELVLKNVLLEEFEMVWKRYFDFSRDYGKLRGDFSGCGHLRNAMEFSPGLRLMKQDVWEILISFILSQNSNIPRIKKMIESLCECFGERLECGGFAFPSAQVLAKLSEEELAPIKCGYRAAYIIDAANRVASGNFNPTTLAEKSSAEIKQVLLEIHGVGPKVADCVLLYGFGRTECYPVDVWIKRVMAEFYPNGFPTNLEKHAGIAQQFLFHYARTGM